MHIQPHSVRVMWYPFFTWVHLSINCLLSVILASPFSCLILFFLTALVHLSQSLFVRISFCLTVFCSPLIFCSFFLFSNSQYLKVYHRLSFSLCPTLSVSMCLPLCMPPPCLFLIFLDVFLFLSCISVSLYSDYFCLLCPSFNPPSPTGAFSF